MSMWTKKINFKVITLFINFIKIKNTMAKNASQKIKEYRLISEQGNSIELTVNDVQFRVNKLINENGFQPFGNPQLIVLSESLDAARRYSVTQAVILYAND